jgi:putative transcriptional regulator
VLTKVTLDVDAFKSEHGAELKFVSLRTSGAPMLVGQKTNSEEMLPGVVYSRHGIPAVSFATLCQLLLAKIIPRYVSCRGAVLGTIRPSRLRELRERQGLTVAEVASRTGLSAKSIRNYEQGRGTPTQANMRRLVEVLGDDSFVAEYNPLGVELVEDNSCDPSSLAPRNTLQREVDEHLRELGFVSAWFRSMPFSSLVDEERRPDAISMPQSFPRTADSLLAGLTADVATKTSLRKMNITASIGKATGMGAMWVVEEQDPSCKDKPPLLVISVSDLEDAARRVPHGDKMSAWEILQLLREVSSSQEDSH